MSYKLCPFCREEIRADATFCRHCNRDLDDEDLLRSRRKIQRLAIGLAALFGGAVLLFLAGALMR